MRRCSARVQEDFGRSIKNATVLRAWELLWDLARLNESIWDVGRPTALRGTSGLRRLPSTRFRASARVHCAKGLARRISLRSLSSWRISTGSWRPRGIRVRRESIRRRGFNSSKVVKDYYPQVRKLRRDGQAAEVSKVDAETVLEELPPLPGHYFITLTRRGRTRRLHCFGSCPTAPGTSCNRWEDYGEDLPPPEKYTVVCQKCWPTGQAGPKASSASSSSSSSSGTSSSSSSESI